MKKCTDCQETKPIDEFNNNPKGAGGKYSKCKTCTRAYAKRQYEKKNKNDYFLRTYGITLADARQILHRQGGWCAICKTEVHFNERRRNSAVVDHCHETGVVRGILCNHCNCGLGMFKDKPNVLRNAAEYLQSRS